MTHYIFHTDLSVDECVERFHASVDRGLPWKREYHPYWEFVGKLRGHKFWLLRRVIIQRGSIPLQFSMNKRSCFGTFVEHGQGTRIHAQFRYPRIVLIATIVGVPLFVVIWGTFLIVVLLTMFGAVPNVFDPPLRPQDGFSILAVYAVVGVISTTMFAVTRRVEREDRQKTVAFVQRAFEAELIEPKPIAGAADVR